MKKNILRIILLTVIFLNAVNLISQNSRMYRPLNFDLSGVKDGVSVKKATRNFDIDVFDDGRIRFEVNLNDINIFADSVNTMTFLDSRLLIEGLYPVVEMRENQQATQNYKFDLNVENNGVSEPMLFDVNVMYNKTNKVSTVIMTTTLNIRNYEALILYGLEPQINLNITFEVKRQQ